MFQTAPILFLQGIPSDFLRQFLLVVNSIGAPATGFALALILVSVDLKKGFLLLQLLIVTAIATELLKEFFALPRPIFVDSNIQFLDQNIVNQSPFVGMGAENFFAGLPQSVVNYHREVVAGSFGFPSGHVSSAFALWGGLALTYRRKGYVLAACFFIPIVALARLYFGKHFLADVLGGVLVAAIILGVWYLYFVRRAPSQHRSAWISSGVAYYAYMGIVPLAFWFAPPGDRQLAAALLGVNLGFVLLRVTDTKISGGTPAQQLGRGAAGASLLVFVLSVLQVPTWLSLDVGETTELVLLCALGFGFISGVGFLAGYMNGLINDRGSNNGRG